MSCTKSQLLVLFNRILKEINTCNSVDCAKRALLKYKSMIEENAEVEVWRDLVRA